MTSKDFYKKTLIKNLIKMFDTNIFIHSKAF